MRAAILHVLTLMVRFLPCAGSARTALQARLLKDKKTVQSRIHFVLPVADREGWCATDVADARCAGRRLSARWRSVREVMKAVGTTPEGAQSEQEASRWVRGMFGRVAHRYDLANHLLSANIDRYVAGHTVEKVRDILRRPDTRVMDLACGTGDLLVALEREAGRELIGSDFCHPMLAGARSEAGAAAVEIDVDGVGCAGDAAAGCELDLITIAFGFRNFANYSGGAGGDAPGVAAAAGRWRFWNLRSLRIRAFAAVYNWYSRKVLP